MEILLKYLFILVDVATAAAPITYRQANLITPVDNSQYKRWLAYIVPNPDYQKTRKRRAAEFKDSKMHVKFGVDSGCNLFFDVAVPCNGPLKPKTKYRYIYKSVIYSISILVYSISLLSIFTGLP